MLVLVIYRIVAQAHLVTSFTAASVKILEGCILQRDVKITEPFPDGMGFGFIAAFNGLQQVFYLTAVQLLFAEVILAESDITP